MEYQEESADFFRSMGLTATTDKTIKGVRTKHDIDVYVTSQHAGFQITWVVECKRWKKPVSKLHVLALREIVSDIGADRGILLSESGFQSGAIEAANLTNVQLTSLAQLSLSACNDIMAMRLRELFDRTEICRERYWDIPKSVRVEYGLRPSLMTPGYSGNSVITFSEEILRLSFRGKYPFSYVPTKSRKELLANSLNSPKEVFILIEPLLSELEMKISDCIEKLNSGLISV
jgi:hypothetical protein